ncbi:hypothetical protein C8Q76DRAFT_741578 [Earliella scabrosa]|nr:hypothetical protein C8Q76DRAFT_741578 [Earliella scabrosa]
MTLLLHYWLVSSGDLLLRFSGVRCYQSVGWKLGAPDEQRPVIDLWAGSDSDYESFVPTRCYGGHGVSCCRGVIRGSD